jgi:TPR repeat protein
MISLALMCEEGTGTPIDRASAKDYLRRAVDHGSITADEMLGARLIEDPDPAKRKEGVARMWAAAKKGEASALRFMSELYSFGVHGKKKCPELRDLFLDLFDQIRNAANR